jgi:hypothetical protein
MKPLALLIVLTGLTLTAACQPLFTAPDKPAPPPPCPPGNYEGLFDGLCR